MCHQTSFLQHTTPLLYLDSTIYMTIRWLKEAQDKPIIIITIVIIIIVEFTITVIQQFVTFFYNANVYKPSSSRYLQSYHAGTQQKQHTSG